MNFAHPSSQQVFTVFGGELVAEQHREKVWNPSQSNIIESLTVSMFDEMIKSLRSTLTRH